jgi:hypothetical protein
MRKAFIIVIQIIVLILFLRTEFAQHFFGGVATRLVSWYENVVNVPERSKIVALRDTFMRNNMSLKPHQFDYVIEVTDSTEEVNRFYQLYCINKDKNPYIYGPNLSKLCSDIEGSELLTNKPL